MKLENGKRIRVMRIIARMNVGGPAIQISGLMRGLNVLEFEHRLFTGYCELNELDYLDTVARDVDVTRIDGFGKSISLWSDLNVFFTLVRQIREFKPQIIHTHTAKAGFLGRLASILSLQPSIRIHTFHGHLLSGYFGKYKRGLVIVAEKTLAIFTQRLLAVGDRVRTDLLDAGVGKEDKFSVMPPGLEIDMLPSKLESQNYLELNSDRLQCAFIGRVTQIKRPDRFLDVVAEINARGLEIDFFIAGSGELLESCRERILKECLPVRILGWQVNIERVLSAADIVVLTSDNEGTPLSLIQAGMASLPVVATNVGSVSEVVLDGVTGILTIQDVGKIADGIQRLASDQELRGQLGANGFRYTWAHFGVQRLVHDHEVLYKQLLSSQAKF